MSPPKVREVIKASKSFSSNKGIEINDYKLSKIQDQSSLAVYPLLHLWQNVSHNEELSYEDIVKRLQQSLVLLGSVNANLNILQRERLATILSQEYASLVYDPSIKGELQRENKLISYERAFKMLENDMYTTVIGQAVLELLSFKVESGNHQTGISLLQKFSEIFGHMRLVLPKMMSYLTSHNFQILKIEISSKPCKI